MRMFVRPRHAATAAMIGAALFRGGHSFVNPSHSIPRNLVRCMTSAVNGPSTNGRLFTEELNVIYDSKCNVCNLEIEFLRRRDARLNGEESPKLLFTDLESGIYNEQDPKNGGVSYAEGMKSMTAVTPSGEIIKGVPVFQKAYEQVKLGWLFKVVTVPGVKQLADLLYKIFAKYRTLVTRGSSTDRLIEMYREKKLLDEQKAAQNCTDNCSVKGTM